MAHIKTIFLSLLALYIVSAVFYSYVTFLQIYVKNEGMSGKELKLPNNYQGKQLAFTERDDVIGENQSVSKSTDTIFDYDKRNITRPDTCVNCFNIDFRFISINDICKTEDFGNITIIFIITTVHSHFTQRTSLRSTWLKHSKNNTSNVRYFFLLGETFNTTLREIVRRENMIYRDIVEAQFRDSYKNLTVKTIMGLKFAISYCKHAQYVMKTDDDVFINIKMILKILQHDSVPKDTVFGNCKRGKPKRNPLSKWYTSVRGFPHSTYPNRCAGPLYGLSMDVARHIIAVSSSVPFFHLEDVYIGLCLQRLGYRVYNLNRILSRWTLKKCDIIAYHSVKSKNMYTMWNKECPE